MTSAIDTGHFEEILKQRRAYLSGRLQAYETSLDQQKSANTAERAIEQENDEVIEALGSSGQLEIRFIDTALSKIERGEYGICKHCGGEIEVGRLEILPHTAICGKCARG